MGADLQQAGDGGLLISGVIKMMVHSSQMLPVGFSEIQAFHKKGHTTSRVENDA